MHFVMEKVFENEEFTQKLPEIRDFLFGFSPYSDISDIFDNMNSNSISKICKVCEILKWGIFLDDF